MITVTKQQIIDFTDIWPNLPEYEFDDPIPLNVLVESLGDEKFVTLCCKTVLTTENQKTEFAKRVSSDTRQTHPWHISYAALQQVEKAELARQRNIILEICK